jgi:hypothetical protein
MDLNSATWRKSTYSGGNGGGCVEVGQSADTVRVRDTKNRDGGELTFSADAWRMFAEQVKATSLGTCSRQLVWGHSRV